jgi:hypothetical protein
MTFVCLAMGFPDREEEGSGRYWSHPAYCEGLERPFPTYIHNIQPLLHCQSQSYLTIDGQSASLSCIRPPSGTRDEFLFLFHGNYLQICAVSFSIGRPL